MAELLEGANAATDARPAAGIVVFRPDLNLLLPLIDAMLQQCAPVIVFLNGPHEALAPALGERPVELIESSYNLGVAEALNILVLAAAWKGKRRLLLLDQDSQLPPAIVARLDEAMDDLAARGERPAAIGPKVVSPADAPAAYRAPRMFTQPGRAPVGTATPVRFLITSGTLLNLDAFSRIGRFRSDYFIDAVDTEWCFRAWGRGFSCWVRTDVCMEHRVGSGIMKAGPFGPPIPLQTDMRLYSYVRNQAHGIRLPHIPLVWKGRFVLHIVRLTLVAWAHHGFRLDFLVNMANAVWRGVRGRLGPPPGAENAAALPEAL
jgi:rhamnosyltransferase